jgi:hypothetical protein
MLPIQSHHILRKFQQKPTIGIGLDEITSLQKKKKKEVLISNMVIWGIFGQKKAKNDLTMLE